MVLELAVLCVFAWSMAFAGAMDLFTMTIPNRVSIVLVVGFLVLAPFMGLGLEGILSHLAAGFAMLIVAIVMFSLGWLGGGDAKLFAASSLWIGFENLLDYAVAISILGGVLTLGLLSWRQSIPHPFLLQQRWAMHLHHPRTGIPYGIALAAAGLLMYPMLPWAAAIRV
jgi:prepilin peptidase CpaA